MIEQIKNKIKEDMREIEREVMALDKEIKSHSDAYSAQLWVELYTKRHELNAKWDTLRVVYAEILAIQFGSTTNLKEGN